MSGNRRFRPKKSHSSAVTRQDLNGGKMKVPENPPEVTYQPWNQAVIVFNFTDKIECTVHSITRQIWQQLDPNQHGFKDCPENNKTSEFRLLIKVQTIRAWALAGKMIALSVEDFLVPNKDKQAVDQLCGIVDTGNANHTPALGYRLPIAHQNAVHRDSKDEYGLQHLFSIQCDGPAICYVNVLWRFDGPSKLPTFNRCMEQMVRDIRFTSSNTNRRVNSLDDRLKKVNEQLDSLIDKQPSIISELSNETLIGAAAVTFAAKDSIVDLFSELKALRTTLSPASSFDFVADSE